MKKRIKSSNIISLVSLIFVLSFLLFTHTVCIEAQTRRSSRRRVPNRTSQTRPATQCNLSIEQSPTIRGFRLGMTWEQLRSLESSDIWREELNRREVYHGRSSLSFDFSDGGNNAFQTLMGFEGLRSINLNFLNGRVSRISIVYESSSGISSDELAQELTRTFNLPQLSRWRRVFHPDETAANEVEQLRYLLEIQGYGFSTRNRLPYPTPRHPQLDCTQFTLSVYGIEVVLEDKIAYRMIEQQRENAAREEARTRRESFSVNSRTRGNTQSASSDTSTSSPTPTQPSAPNPITAPSCTLNLAQSLNVRGLRLGMPIQDVISIFGGVGRQYQFGPGTMTDANGIRIQVLNYLRISGEIPNTEEWQSVNDIHLQFIDNSLYLYRIRYDNSQMNLWGDTRGFLEVLARSMTLPPGFVRTTNSISYMPHPSLTATCDGWTIEITGTQQMGEIKVTNVAAMQARLRAIEEERRNEQERRRGTFRP
jgi:hypothetical protein